MVISARMAEANPHLPNPNDSEALIMIDEVDLHLHPRFFKVLESTGEMRVIEENCTLAGVDMERANNSLDEEKLNLNSKYLKKWRKEVMMGRLWLYFTGNFSHKFLLFFWSVLLWGQSPFKSLNLGLSFF